MNEKEITLNLMLIMWQQQAKENLKAIIKHNARHGVCARSK